MNTKTTLSILFYITAILFSACKEKPYQEPSTDYGYEYFPVEVGFWQIYQVKEIIWDDFNSTVDSSYYQTKELIESEIVTPNKDTLYRLECYFRADKSQEWQLKHVYFLRKEKLFVERVEENLTYCKMVFPILEHSAWNEYISIDSTLFYQTHYPNTGIINANVKNTNAYVTGYKTPATIGSLSFDKTISICLHEFTSIINQDVEKEQYAENVGMIYQYIAHTENKATGGQFYIYNGFIRETKIIDYKH